MNKQKIFNFIVDFLAKRGKLPENRKEILSYSYLETGHIDSFGMVQLLMSIEDEFNITLLKERMESPESIDTVQKLVDVIASSIKKKS